MQPQTVTQKEWLAARVEFLAREKEFTKARDALSAARRALPRHRMEEDFHFEGPEGRVTFDDLFDGHSQLIVYHFMYGADWDEGCPSCSFWADNFNGIGIHLAHRDTRLVAISTAASAPLEAYKKRMGWDFPWYASGENGFNQALSVTFSADQVANKSQAYNYKPNNSFMTECPGISVFTRDPDGAIYHSYSTYSRGLDMLNGAYHYLDLTPKGRDEEGLESSQAWLRRSDSYED